MRLSLAQPAAQRHATPLESDALAALNEAVGVVPEKGKTTPGTFGWLTARYLASDEFKRLVVDSQATRRAILDACMAEPIRPGANETMAGCPLSVLAPKHIKTLRDRKAGLPGAANNRRKYLSTMLGWAVEEGLIKTNPAREVRYVKSVTSGYHSWSIDEVRQFEARHKIGTIARLALNLMLYLGVRRGDAVRPGPAQVSDGVISFVPSKTSYVRRELSHCSSRQWFGPRGTFDALESSGRLHRPVVSSGPGLWRPARPMRWWRGISNGAEPAATSTPLGRSGHIGNLEDGGSAGAREGREAAEARAARS